MSKSYPIFEPNEVLTHQQLNDVVTHFDEEVGASRAELVGVAIISGLTVDSDLKSVTINPGCGVTTAGDIVSFDRQTSYTHYREYRDPSQETAPLVTSF